MSPTTYSFKQNFRKTTSTASSSSVREKDYGKSSPTPSTHKSFQNQDRNGESSRSSYHSFDSRQSSKKTKPKEIIQNMREISIKKEFEEDAHSGYSRPNSVDDRINSLRGLRKNDTEDDTRSTASKSSRASSFASRIAAFESRSAAGAATPCLPRTHLVSATPTSRPPLSNAALQDAAKEGGLW